MTKDAWFAVKVAGLNALAFSINLAGVTWIDARLTSHVAFGARTYPYGYPLAVAGGPAVFASTLLVLTRAFSWKVRATVPAAILAGMGLLALPFFLPEFPHGGVSEVPHSSQPIPFTPPLKILAVGASPRGLPALNLDEEMRRLEEAIHSARPDAFEWATPVLFLRLPEGNVFVARPAHRGYNTDRREGSR